MIYTREDWRNDRTFKAAPGQEITEEIYETMFDVMPIYNLPRCEATQGYTAGFLVSEPYDCEPGTGKFRYPAFGKRQGKYYFIGHMTINGRM